MIIITWKKPNQPTTQTKTTSIQELWIYKNYTGKSNMHVRRK